MLSTLEVVQQITESKLTPSFISDLLEAICYFWHKEQMDLQ